MGTVYIEDQEACWDEPCPQGKTVEILAETCNEAVSWLHGMSRVSSIDSHCDNTLGHHWASEETGSNGTGKGRRYVVIHKIHRSCLGSLRTVQKEMDRPGASARGEGRTFPLQLGARGLINKYKYEEMECPMWHLEHKIYKIEWLWGSGRQYDNVMSGAGGCNNKGWWELWQTGRRLLHSKREQQITSR